MRWRVVSGNERRRVSTRGGSSESSSLLAGVPFFDGLSSFGRFDGSMVTNSNLSVLVCVVEDGAVPVKLDWRSAIKSTSVLLLGGSRLGWARGIEEVFEAVRGCFLLLE